MPDELHGTLARVRVYKPESGWASIEVAHDAAKKARTTIVGHALCQPYLGMEVFASGKFTRHERWGEQFEATDLTLTPPTSIELRKSYIRELVPALSTQEAWLAAQFEGDLATAIVPDIPEDKAVLLRKAWAERALDPREIRFLRECNVELPAAIQIVKYFAGRGESASSVARENPFALMRSGVSFATADSVALALDSPRESPERMSAGLAEAARRRTSDGHTLVDRETLVHDASTLLAAMPRNLDLHIDTAVAAGLLIRRHIGGVERFQEPRLFALERAIADDIKRLSAIAPLAEKPNATRFAQICGFEPDPEQVAAVHAAFEHGVSITTGGPGCGKTTIMRVLAQTFPGNVWLVAPTGMAAKRLSEATGRTAATIHSFLGGQLVNDQWAFNFHRQHQLRIAGSLVIVDEGSMVDTEVAAALLEAIPDGCRVAIVGDVDQLPSVGPGAVLADLIAGGVRTTVLRHIHRQGEDSPIPFIARAVIDGQRPEIPPHGPARLIEARSPDYAYELYAVVRGMIEAGVRVDDVCVLAPMWAGPYGIDTLNAGLQRIWNERGAAHGGVLCHRAVDASTNEVFEEYLCPGDRAIMMRNDHLRKVYNGDILHVIDCGMHGKLPWLDAAIVGENGHIRFEGAKQVKQLRLGYARTIHRAQGGEFPHVVVSLVEAHRRMLQRRILYTAVSRAQRTLTIVGHAHAVHLAVKDAGGVTTRETGLADLFANHQDQLVLAAG